MRLVLIPSLVAALGLAGAAPARAQESPTKPPADRTPWTRMTMVEVIPSMVEEFIAAQRELSNRAKEDKIPWRTVSRTEVFGDQYRFFIATPLASLASFDEKKDPDPAMAALDNRVERCITASRSYALRNLPDAGNPLPPGQVPDLMVINVARVFPGREQDYLNVMTQDFLPHFDEAKMHHVMGTIAFGGATGFLHVFYVDDFAQLDRGSPVMRALGPEGASAVNAKLAGVVSSSELWVARAIPDLSFGPPAPAESEKR